MAISIPQDLPVNAPKRENLAVINFTEGQVSDLEGDKIRFSASTKILNMIIWKNNLEMRPGSFTLKDSLGVFALGELKRVGENKLIEFVRNGDNTDINAVDKISGDTNKLIEDFSGQGDWDYANGNQSLYLCNNGSNKIQKLTPDLSGTIEAVADYSGTEAGTVQITDTAHGLSTGDFVVHDGTTDYNGEHQITVIDDDSYYIEAPFTTDQTGTWTSAAGAHEELSLNNSDTAKLISYGSDRLICAGELGLYYSRIGASQGTAGNAFDNNLGTYDATTGRYPFGVSHGGTYQTGNMFNYTGLVTVGNKSIVFNKEMLQVHELPDSDIATYIDEERTTLQFEKNYGIKDKNAVKVIKGLVYFTNDDGAFILDPATGEVEEMEGDTDFHQTIDWESGCIGYSKRFRTLLMGGGINSNNDIIHTYSDKYNAFGQFTGWQPMQFIESDDDVFFFDKNESKIVKCMAENIYTDDSLPIKYECHLGVADGGTPNLYKKLREVFVDVATEGTSPVYTDVLFDKLPGLGHQPNVTYITEFNELLRTFVFRGVRTFGRSSWGRLDFKQASSFLQESLKRYKNRSKFMRVQISVRGASSRKVSLRRIMIQFTPTLKKVKDEYIT